MRVIFLSAVLCTKRHGRHELCRSQSQGLYGVGDIEGDRGKIRKLVGKLAAAKTMIESAEDEATFEEAKSALILMGSNIQGVLFEELASSDDWGVRYGIVHVLSAIGTQRMVEPLIAVLDDPEPQVAGLPCRPCRLFASTAKFLRPSTRPPPTEPTAYRRCP